jgi:hypothetical protein
VAEQLGVSRRGLERDARAAGEAIEGNAG